MDSMDPMPPAGQQAEQIPQREALRLQLALIAGDEPPCSYFEIRSKRSTGGMRQDFVPLAQADRAASMILNRGQLGDVYVGAAPRVRASGRTEAIERVQALWVDCDTPAAVELLRRFEPAPNFIIRSGSGDNLHAWWQLRRPVTPAHARRANRRLALALSADRAATDAARIMRPVGTFNHKVSPPAAVECVRLELDTHDLADLVGGLPDDPAEHPRSARPAATVGDDVDPGRMLAGLARVVREAPVGERNARLNWAAFRAAEHAATGRLDIEDVGPVLLDAALDAGLSEREALRTIASGTGADADRRVAA